jgi:hypothetical protein
LALGLGRLLHDVHRWLDSLLEFQRIVIGLRRAGQRTVLHSQPVQHILRGLRQIAPQAEKAASTQGKFRDQQHPIVGRKLHRVQRGCRDIWFLFGQEKDQRGIAEPPPSFAQDCSPFARRNLARQVGQAFPAGLLQRVDDALLPFVEQIEQLTVLRTRRSLTRGTLAQNGGKAVVEMHGFSR